MLLPKVPFGEKSTTSNVSDNEWLLITEASLSWASVFAAEPDPHDMSEITETTDRINPAKTKRIFPFIKSPWNDC